MQLSTVVPCEYDRETLHSYGPALRDLPKIFPRFDRIFLGEAFI